MTVTLAILQSTGLVFLFNNQFSVAAGLPADIIPPDKFDAPHIALIVLTLAAGTAMIMWMGELITQRGIGNGMSIMIFTSVISRLPSEGLAILHQAGQARFYFFLLLGVAIIFAGELKLDVPLEGLIAIFLAATAASLSSVFLKRTPQPSAIAANAVGAAAGAIVCAAVSLVIGEDHSLPSTLAGWGPIVYLTLAGSLGAYVLYTWLVQHWPVTNASMVGVVVPVLAVILGAVAKQEQRSPESYLGAAVVLVAVIVALRPWAGTRYAGGPAVAK